MALATQCPHCYTSFRVANDQLKLHAGMVRCGACKQTFNGIEHLLEPGEAARTPPSQQEPEVSSPPSPSHHEEIASGNAVSPDASQPSEESTIDMEDIVDEGDTHLVDTSGSESAIKDTQDPVNNEMQSADASSVSDTAASDETAQFHLEDTTESISNDEVIPNFEDPLPNQQELDDIALFQAKLASFAPQLDLPDTSTFTPNNEDDKLVTEQASTQLETIQTEATYQDIDESEHKTEDNSRTEAAEASPAEVETPRRPASLTATIDFELSDEERSWAESSQVSQLEVQTQAAIIASDSSKYSKHEPVFSDDTVLEDELEQDIHQLLAEVKTPEYMPPAAPVVPAAKTEPSFITEAIESTKDAEPEFDAGIEDDQPDFMLKAEKAQRYSKLQYVSLWMGVIFLLLAASAQSVYFFRSGIAAHFPQTKPMLLQMCQKLNCQLKLPTQIDAIVFDSTELLTLNQDPHVLSLGLQLQNKSNMTQAWPMLELTLKDSRGKTVLQRVFTPEEYLESKSLVSKGFNANSESSIKVHFELSTMKAANYAVGVFYP